MMRTIPKLSCCILFSATVLFASCNKEEAPDNPSGSPSDGIEVELGAGMDWCGVVVDADGDPVEAGTVSDGYSCVSTGADGIWQLKGSDHSERIFISIPAEYQVPMADGLPCFWQTIEKGKTRYDFVLTPLAAPENDFFLFCLADPQCQNNDRHTKRFIAESVPDVHKTATEYSKKYPVYGITLGDIGYNVSGTEYNISRGIFKTMKTAMASEKTGFPLFQLMGNHDHHLIATNTSYNEEADIEMEKYFAKSFGPVNYSFNRGRAHIVAMDDILATNPESSYSCGFRDDQVEWLRQDLANVPKDMLLILCVHIPLYSGSSGKNVKTVLEMCKEFAECHIMSGHTHRSINTPSAAGTGIYEHTHGAVCGAWWWSTVNTDGTPNGYGIYTVNGNHISDWLYKGVDMDASDQIRLYRGNIAYMNGKAQTYSFAMTSAADIWANIWNWDSSWTVDVYEDGVKTGRMSIYNNDNSARDAWAVGYHVGVIGRSAQNYDKTNVKHLLHYTLKNPQAAVEIRATDRFGHEYVQNVFTGNTHEFWPIAPGDNY